MAKRQPPKKAATRRVAIPDPPPGQGDSLVQDPPELKTQDNGQGQEPPAKRPPGNDLWPEAEEEARKKAELDARIADAVSRVVSEKVAELNRVLSGIPQVITEATKNEVKGQLDGVMQEIKAAILAGQQAAVVPGQQPQPQAQVGQFQQAPQGGMDGVLTLLNTLMGGNKGGSGGLEASLGALSSFMNAAEAVYQRPRESALKDLVTFMKAGLSSGMSNEQVTNGLEKLSKGPNSNTDIFKASGNDGH